MNPNIPAIWLGIFLFMYFAVQSTQILQQQTIIHQNTQAIELNKSKFVLQAKAFTHNQKVYQTLTKGCNREDL